MHEADELLSEARDGGRSADELFEMHNLLLARLQAMHAEFEGLPEESPERRQLGRRVKALEEQVTALREEANITEFVEGSALAALKMSQLRGV